jgi:hypothetical protein
MTSDRFEVRAADDLRCHRCGGPLLCTVEVPYSLQRTDGVVVPGTRTVGLCQNCDKDDPAGRGLIAFFTVHLTAEAHQLDEVGALIREWVSALPSSAEVSGPPDATERAWRAGEL